MQASNFKKKFNEFPLSKVASVLFCFCFLTYSLCILFHSVPGFVSTVIELIFFGIGIMLCFSLERGTT